MDEEFLGGIVGLVFDLIALFFLSDSLKRIKPEQSERTRAAQAEIERDSNNRKEGDRGR
jgi:hypothetical protein